MVFGAFTDVEQLQDAAVAQLLGQGAAEALEGALGAGGKRVVETFRGAAEDHQVRAVLQVFQQRLEKFAQLLELIGVLQVAGVEHHGLELGAVAGNPSRGLAAIGVDGVGKLVGKRLYVSCQRATTQ